MNLSIFMSSVKYLDNVKLVVSLSQLINQELTYIFYKDIKLRKSFYKGDIKVFKAIIHLIEDKRLFDRYVNTKDYHIAEILIRCNLVHTVKVDNQIKMIKYLINNRKRLDIEVSNINFSIELPLLKRNYVDSITLIAIICFLSGAFLSLMMLK